MGRILLLLLIAFAIYLLIRGFLKSQRRDAKPDLPVAGENMVTCANCGVNLPRSSTQEKDGKPVCRDNPHCLPPT